MAGEGVRTALVTVVCKERHSDDQGACYWTFVRQMGRLGERVWVESSREGSVIELVDGAAGHRDARPAVVKILDVEGNRRHGLSATAGRGYRRAFDIKCMSCRFALSKPAERIEPAFDRIAATPNAFPSSPESGAPEIGLRLLAAMVKS
jgi:hypothetical protein